MYARKNVVGRGPQVVSECDMCIMEIGSHKDTRGFFVILGAVRLEVDLGWMRSWRSMLDFCAASSPESGHKRLERLLSGSVLIP
jgi:hypothetical protein